MMTCIVFKQFISLKEGGFLGPYCKRVGKLIYAGKKTYLDSVGMSGMVEVALLIEKKTFDEMIRFVMKAMKEGIPEDGIWATLEVMSSKELQADIAEGLREIREGKVMRFRSAKEALEWLKS